MNDCGENSNRSLLTTIVIKHIIYLSCSVKICSLAQLSDYLKNHISVVNICTLRSNIIHPFHNNLNMISAGGMWKCRNHPCAVHAFTCEGWPVWVWESEVLTPDRMLSVSHAGGFSSTRKATSPQTQPSAPSSLKWKEWATPTWMEARECGMCQTTSSLRRFVSWCYKVSNVMMLCPLMKGCSQVTMTMVVVYWHILNILVGLILCHIQ